MSDTPAAQQSHRIYHADHCGSLLRPPELRRARIDHVNGSLGDAALAEIEDRVILEALALQRQVGLEIFSDGEFRRKYWHQAVVAAFDGVVDAGPDFARFPAMRTADLAANPEIAAPNPVVTGRLRAKGRIAAHEAAFLKAHAPGAFKITMPSPAMVTRKWLSRDAGRAAYPAYEELLHDMARLLAAEARALAEDGVRYIQLDAPGYTRFMIRDRVEKMKRDGLDPAREFAALVEADNQILRSAKREGVTVAVHICHGTYFLDGRGPNGGAAVAYDTALAAQLYNSLEADTFLVEYTDRGGSAESLKEAPKDRTYALGVLNIRDPHLESRDEILRKIEAAAKHVAPEHLALCPNCGFSGAAAGAWIAPDDQKRKLERLVETAAQVWR